MKRRFLSVLSVWACVLTVASCSEGWPRDLTTNDQQQAAIYMICEKAARSPAASLEEIVSIGQFCLNWRAIVQSNDASPKEPPAKDPEPKE